MELDTSTAEKMRQMKITKIEAHESPLFRHERKKGVLHDHRFAAASPSTKAREPRAHVARFVEMSGNALRTPPNGKGETAEIRHDRKHRFIGDIVADKKRTASRNGSWVINSRNA